MVTVERELTVNQRNLVDTCFEEGNYDAAISLMDKLRHPKYRPNPIHIRNLVYIALYPPQVADEPDAASSRLDVISTSPTKMSAKNQHSSFAPTPTHSAAAQRLLRAFAQTNTSMSICRALPSYESPAASNVGKVFFSANADFGDSEISKHSRHIAEAKSCWQILKEDFIQAETNLAQDSLPIPGPKSRRSRRTAHIDPSESDEMVAESPDPVGPLAWPLLDWLLTVFEKDESSSTESEHIKYSPLLLSQIPPSRSASGSCWDVETPLDIAFYCLQDPLRLRLGSRLLVLLINLASTTYIDLTMVLNSTCTRMSSLSSEEIQTIFALLPATLACMQFKIALCRTYLTTVDDPKTTTNQKPLPKAAPRPQPARQRRASSKESSVAPSVTSSETNIQSAARRYPAVTPAEFIRLISSAVITADQESSVTARTLQFKFQLLCAFGGLREQQPQQDQDWEKMVQSGELPHAIDQGFGCSDDGSPEVQAWAQDLKAVLAVMGWYR